MNHSGLASLFTIADKILFFFSAALIIASYFYFWQSTPAHYAVVKSPQQNALFIDLNDPKVHNVKGHLGISTLKVHDGQIRFTASPCKNKICIQSGWHQHGGAITACLPNRISVQLTSQSSTPGYDAIIF